MALRIVERNGAVRVVVQVVFQVDASGVQVHELPARRVALEERIGTIHRHRQNRQVALRQRIALRIRPGPGGRHHRGERDVVDLVVLDLVHVAVDHGDLVERLQERLDLLGVLGPEVPALVDLLQRRVREDDDGRALPDLPEVVPEPLHLLLAHHERRAVGIIQPGHLGHAPLIGLPSVVPLVVGQDAVQRDEVHALVVPAVVVIAEELAPVLTQVEVVVVLAHNRIGLVVEP